jgi:hypothetical protein
MENLELYSQNVRPSTGNSVQPSPTVSPVVQLKPTTNQTVQTTQTSENDSNGANLASFILPITLTLLILVLAAAGVAAGLYYYSILLKKKDRDDKGLSGVIFEIKVPRTNETEIAVAEQMFSNLYGIGGGGKGWKEWITVKNCISFEMVGLPGEIRFYVYSPKKLADLVEKQILGAYQDAEVTIVDEYNIFEETSKVAYASLMLTDESYYPLKTASDFKGDPLANILSSLSRIGPGEGVIVQFVISPAESKWQKAGRKFIQKVETNNSDPEKKKISVSQEQIQGIGKKISKLGFNTAIRIVATAPNQDIAQMHVDNIIGALEQFSNPGINDMKKDKLNKLKEIDFMRDIIFRRMPLKNKTILNVEELSSLFHFPNKNIETPNINWLMSKDSPAANWISSDIGTKDAIWLGNNYYRGNSKRICFKREDRRKHSYILGQTGSGKSRLLLRMMYQDMMNGDGLCFIDPHGSTAEALLQRVPHERIEDVIYLSAADFERPFGFNLMEFNTEQDKHMVINGFIELLKKMYDPHNQGIVGPILERAFRNSMLTAMSVKGSTLLEVLRIMTDDKWVNEKWLPLVKDELVKRYWTDQIAKTNEFHKSETLGYLTSKFDRFVTNLAMRNIICQSTSSFNMREAMDSGKIIIVNLAKGLMGEENAQFLGLLMIPKIVSAALSREDIMNEEDRRDFFFYVDEFQNFASESFASILSEARKYHLNLTVANQYIAQLDDKVKTAVFGNVGSLLIARCGPEDAKFLEAQFQPTFSAEDIQNQPNQHYYTKLMTDERYPAPFSLEPGWGSWFPNSGFDMPQSKETAELVKQMSRLKYGRDVNLVTEEINSRSELAVKNDKPEGSTGMPSLPMK